VSSVERAHCQSRQGTKTGKSAPEGSVIFPDDLVFQQSGLEQLVDTVRNRRLIGLNLGEAGPNAFICAELLEVSEVFTVGAVAVDLV
jgi:hypothetical protein